MGSDSKSDLLTILQDIYDVSEVCSTRTYIWAGLVPDIVQGRLLRDHHDIDGFTMDLLENRDALTVEYRARGYTVTYLEEFDILRIDRNGLHAGFNNLEIRQDTALWYHIGTKGTVFFPKKWLPEMSFNLQGVRSYISGLEFEYCIKKAPSLLSPIWKRRDKDTETLSWLHDELLRRKIEPAELLRDIWSENPFWAERGYKEYSLPFHITAE